MRNGEPAAAVVVAVGLVEEGHGTVVEPVVAQAVEGRGMVVELADGGRSIVTYCGRRHRHGLALGSQESSAGPLASG